MADDYVPRPEFELFCAQQNGSLRRIEASLANLNEKIDKLSEDIGNRVSWDAFERMHEETKEELKILRMRISPAMAAFLTILCSLVSGLVVGILVSAL